MALARLLEERLPRRQLRFVAGYGSGVFRQPGAERAAAPPVLDALVVVGRDGDDEGPRRESALASWHLENMSRNPSHYGGALAMLPRAGAAARLARAAGAIGCGVHFVAPFALDDGAPGAVRCKYGVLDADEAVADLTEWRTLAFAGRMQKPTLDLLAGDGAIADAQSRNVRAALATAVLLLPEEFDEGQLFRTIVGLSYGGDLRMALGAERVDKVAAIAEGSVAGLRAMYASGMRALLHETSAAGCARSYRRAASVRELLSLVPIRPLRECAALARGRPARGGAAGIVRDLLEFGGGGGAGERWRHDGPGAGCLRRALRSIVFETSVRMAAYSLLTTDLTRALSYAYAKACKGVLAR